eukprot:gene5698-7251_t
MDHEESTHVFVRELGRGSFGVASLYRRADDALVVVKEFDIENSDAPARRKAILESETLNLLEHPNIIRYYDAFEDTSKFFLEMEYADGGNLRQLIENQNGQFFPEIDILFYTWQLLNGLSYVHECGILHRDLKSENVFLTATNILKLGDFGIAKVLSDASQVQSVVGTPYYMAPEMFKGEPYGRKCDVFSAGCVMHEMCTLHRTFQATNMGAIMNRVLKRQYTPLRGDLYRLELRSLVDAMLEVDVEQRITANEALQRNIFEDVRSSFEDRFEFGSSLSAFALSVEDKEQSQGQQSISSVIFTSKSTQLYVWGGGRSKSLMATFSTATSPMQLAIGSGHCAVCTADMKVYTWSMPGAISEVDGFSSGQLGHFPLASQRQPKALASLARLPCIQVACGENFTFCILKQGQVLAFGANCDGCLGVGKSPEDEDMSVFLLPDAPLNLNCHDMEENDVVFLLKSNTISQESCYLNSNNDKSSTVAPISIAKGDVHDAEKTRQAIEFLDSESSMHDVRSKQHQHIVAVNDSGNVSSQDSALSDDKIFDCNGNAVIPIIVPFFRTKQSSQVQVVKQIACGSNHVAVISGCSELYTWGDGEFGKLGNGGEDTIFKPMHIELPKPCTPKFVACGIDATAVITRSGRLFVSGNNEYNKLCIRPADNVLARRRSFVSADSQLAPDQDQYQTCYTFTPVKHEPFHTKIRQVAIGANHMAALNADGRVITCGKNDSGQLGAGDYRKHSTPIIVAGALSGVRVSSIACGDSFSFAVSTRGELFGWGKNEAQRLCSVTKNTSEPRHIRELGFVAEVAVRGAVTLCKTEEITSSRRMAQLSVSQTSDNDDRFNDDLSPHMQASMTQEPNFEASFVSSQCFNENVSFDSSSCCGNSPLPCNRENPSINSCNMNEHKGRDNNSNDDDDKSIDEDEIPKWLKAELAGPYIPISAASDKNLTILDKPESSSPNQSNMDPSLEGYSVEELKAYIQEQTRIIASLRLKNQGIYLSGTGCNYQGCETGNKRILRNKTCM